MNMPWRRELMAGEEGVSFKVMVVEDDQAFRSSVAGLLRSRFPSIVIAEAGDGAEAMKKVKSFLPQLIFMDIKLPDQNGLEITRKIRALYPAINIIVLTSYDFPEYREAARASGAYGFLSKCSSTADEIQDLVKAVWAKCSAQIV
jgi:DNA-binding NarL/FixJ family response regulator